MTTAYLGFGVHSETVPVATDRLHKMAAATLPAEKAVNSLNAASMRAAGGGKAMAQASEMMATAQSRVVSATRASTIALQAQQRAQRLVMNDSKQLSFQLIDIGQALATAPTMGIYALQNLGFQIAQIGQLYMGRGGFNQAIRDSATLVGRFVVRMGPLIGVAGAAAGAIFSIKKSADAATSSTVTFGHVFQGIMKAISVRVDAALDPLQKRFGWVWDWIADKTKWLGNLIINSFRAAASDLKFIWNQLPNIVGAATIGMANAVLAGTEKMINGAIGLLNSFAAKANNILPDSMQMGSMEGVNFGRMDNPYSTDLAKANAEHRKQIEQIMSSDPLGNFYNDAVKFTVKAAIADDKDLQKAIEKYKDLVLGAQQFIETQELERKTIGMTAEAAARLRYEQELLHKAANDNLKLSPAQREELKQLAGQMAEAEAATNHLREAFDFAKDVTKGFFGDLRSGMEEGKGIWRSFADAATNALDKIVDKLLNDVVDALFQVNSAGSSGGGGGFWGALGSIVGGLFGGGKRAADPWNSGGMNLRIGANAMGTDNWRGGPTWVGERGPEIVNLPRGAQVIPNHIAAANNNRQAASNSNAPMVKIEIINNTPAQARVEEGRGADGSLIKRVVIDEVNDGFGAGRFDGAMRGFGARPQRAKR